MMVSPMRKENQKFTYQDYLLWPGEERWEIIDGVAYNMCPAPTWNHQRIAVRISSLLEFALEGKKCETAVSPIDVILSDNDVVQPDVIVVCDKSKITPQGVVKGAPDLVVEILSPSTATKDQTKKKFLYEENGVREYLVVDPVWQCVNRFALTEEGKFAAPDYFHVQQELLLISLPGLSLPLWKVFGVEKKEEEQ